MRPILALILVLCSSAAWSQEADLRDSLVSRLEQRSGKQIEFDLSLEEGRRLDRERVLIPVTLSLAVDQLSFADDGAELAAKFSIVSFSGGEPANAEHVREYAHRIAAPRGTQPEGTGTYRFDLVADRSATTATIVVFDESSGRVGTRSVTIDGTRARLEGDDAVPAPDALWRDLLARAGREKKPIVVFFRSPGCGRCRELERVSLNHPTIERRLPSVVFASLPSTSGEAAKLWSSSDSGVAFFDRSGALRVRWTIVPDTTSFGIILDSIVAVAPHFERALQLSEAGQPHDAELEVAAGLTRIGRVSDARAALARARANGSAETRQAALVSEAVLDATEGKVVHAVAQLRQVASAAVTPKLAAESWMALGRIHRSAGANDEAMRAFAAAAEHAQPGSPLHDTAQQALTRLRAATTPGRPIRILPLARQVVSGTQTVRTHVASTAVARVTFSLDEVEVAHAERPPFSAAVDFGAVPARRVVRAVAFDRKGQEIGRDTRVVNEAGETFWVRLVSPREGFAGGRVRVSMDVRTPVSRRVRRVVVSWNDAERATLTAPPWEPVIDIPAGVVGVLRVVAELDDGRTSEDAVLLNAGGAVEQAHVQLVELPITVLRRDGLTPEITAERITIREGETVRRVESVATAAETPLTIGVLIDASASMQKPLPDVQEAAIRFLETMLGERDRAFLVTFDSEARLLQPATSDVALLRRSIMSITPNGRTALHDAMVLGLLQFEGIKGRRAMIVFSDGVDSASRYGAADVSELARRVHVPIHVISAAAGDTSRPADARERELSRVAASTGGIDHPLAELTELPAVYARIGAALRAQILAFVRTEAAAKENEWRRVLVSVDGEDLEVYAPEGYYASW